MEYRPRLSDEELHIVVVALKQYASGKVNKHSKWVAERLGWRLTDRAIGNPSFNYPTDFVDQVDE